MDLNEQKYIDLFYSEAFENKQELDKTLTFLEKDPNNRASIETIFRITHTLKGNAMGLGLDGIAEISHVMEDIFIQIKDNNIELTSELFSMLFKANDKLEELIESLKSKKKISYKGLKTKLNVFLRKKAENDEIAALPKEDNLEAALTLEKLDSNENNPIKEEAGSTKIAFSDQIQVSVSKLDNLMNLVGELMIEKDSLVAQSTNNSTTTSSFSRLHRITSDLQYSVMDVRMVQVGFFFNKFFRTIRDVASVEKKKVNLLLEGTEIEIDRNILKIISDSMIHIIRNSVSHGIEKPEVRRKYGKSDEGSITLTARNDKDKIVISISDDGAGINVDKIKEKAIQKNLISNAYAQTISEEEVLLLIFEPGFSGAEKVTEISGRGVGMDVVKKAVESIGGRVSVHSELGVGTTIQLDLPSSMAVKGALLFELEQQEFAIPLAYTEAVVSLYKKDIHIVRNGLMASYLDKTISIVFLSDIYDLPQIEDMRNNGVLHKTYNVLEDDKKLDVLIVSYNNKWMGLVVDKLIQQKEIVEKTLQNPLDRLEIFSGATILGNGNVCLVLDVTNILRTYFSEKR